MGTASSFLLFTLLADTSFGSDLTAHTMWYCLKFSFFQ